MGSIGVGPDWADSMPSRRVVGGGDWHRETSSLLTPNPSRSEGLDGSLIPPISRGNDLRKAFLRNWSPELEQEKAAEDLYPGTIAFFYA